MTGNKQRIDKGLKKWAIPTVILLCVYRFALPLGLDLVVNQPGLLSWIEQSLADKLDTPVDIEHIGTETTFTKGFVVHLDQVSINNLKLQSQQALNFKGKNLQLYLDYRNLVAQKFSPYKAILNDTQIYLSPLKPIKTAPQAIQKTVDVKRPQPETPVEASQPELLPEIEINHLKLETPSYIPFGVTAKHLSLVGAKLPLTYPGQKINFKLLNPQFTNNKQVDITPWKTFEFETEIIDPLEKMKLFQRAVNLDSVLLKVKDLNFEKLNALMQGLNHPMPEQYKTTGTLNAATFKWLRLDEAILLSLSVDANESLSLADSKLPTFNFTYNSQLKPQLYPEPWISLEDIRSEILFNKGSLQTKGQFSFPYRFLKKNAKQDWNEANYQFNILTKGLESKQFSSNILKNVPQASNLTSTLNLSVDVQHQSLKPIEYRVQGNLTDVNLFDRYDRKTQLVKNAEVNFKLDDSGYIAATQLKSQVPKIRSANFYRVNHQTSFEVDAEKIDTLALQKIISQYAPDVSRYFNLDSTGEVSTHLAGLIPKGSGPLKLLGDLDVDIHMATGVEASKPIELKVPVQQISSQGYVIKNAALQIDKHQLIKASTWLGPLEQVLWLEIEAPKNISISLLNPLIAKALEVSVLLPHYPVIPTVQGEAQGQLMVSNLPGQSSVEVLAKANLNDIKAKTPYGIFEITEASLALLNNQYGYIDAFGRYLTGSWKAKGNLSKGEQSTLITLNVPELGPLQKNLSTYFPELSQLNQVSGKVSGEIQLFGELLNPTPKGIINLVSVAGCSVSYQGLCIKNGNGQLAFENGVLKTAQPFKANILDAPLEFTGLFSQQTQNWQVKGQQISIIKLEQALKQIPQFKSLLSSGFIVKDGKVNLDLAFNGLSGNPISGFIEFNQFKGLYQQNNLPITVNKGRWDVRTGQIQIPSILVEGLAFNAKGQFNPQSKKYQINASGQNLGVDKVLHLLRQLSPDYVPDYMNPKGQVSLTLQANNQLIQLNTQLKQAGISLKTLPFPLDLANGDLGLSLQKGQILVSTKGIDYRYANSPMRLVLQGQPFTATGKLLSQGTLSPLLLNFWMNGLNADEPFYLKIPYQVIAENNHSKTSGLKAHLDSWFIKPEAEEVVPNQIELAYKETLPKLSSDLTWQGDKIVLDDILLQVDQLNSIFARIERSSSDILLPSTTQSEFKTTDNFPLESLYQTLPIRLFEGLKGTLTASGSSLLDESNINHIFGSVVVNGLQSKTLAIQNGQFKITANDQELDWQIENFKIPGVDVGFTAQTPDLNLRPLSLDNFNLVGKEFIISLYNEWFVNNFRKPFLNHPVVKALFPPRPNQVLGFDIPQGKLALDEIIVNNIIVNNYKSDLQLFATSTMDFNNITAKVADGHLAGNATFNPKDDNYIRAHLFFNDMQANAVARALLGVNNQVFGRLNGLIDFTTEGEDQIEWLSRSNAYAEFKITQGRLPAVTQIENKMILADTLAGGLFNLNLNSIFKVLQPVKSDYFADLSGIFKVSNGLLVTDNLTTAGDNFNLDIKGQVKLVTAEADMKIKGTVNKQIKGILGGIGSLSIGKLFSFIPPLQKLVSWIPGIGFIPGLGRKTADRGLGFELDLIGPIDAPESLKNFRWAE